MGNAVCIIVVLCYGTLCQLLFMAKQQSINSEAAAIWEHCIIVHKVTKCVCMSCYNYVYCVQGVAEKQLC